MKKTWILAVILGAVAIAPFLYLAYHMLDARAPKQGRTSLAVVEFQPKIKPTAIEVGATFTVMSVSIHDGYRFSLNLEGADVEAHLPVATKEEAIPVVIDLLNSTTPPPPTVTLLRHVDGEYWIVDIQLTKDGERENLGDYLRSKDLLLD
jgi:hypothetical protein